MSSYLLSLAIAVTLSTAAAGDSLNVDSATLSLQPLAIPTGTQETAPADGSHKRYGDAGTKWWTFGGGAASDFDTSDDYNLHVGWSWFLVDRFEWGVEGGAWYFDQEGENEYGGSAHMLFRWHFWMSEDRKWSLFTDAGIGLLASTGDVPEGGTSFDFMPRVGVGATRAISESTRLEAGIRWHHVSNARINGDNNNPSRDGVLLYAGLIFPF